MSKNHDLEGPESPRQRKITERKQEFIALSDATAWRSHWDHQLGNSRRCGQERCELCRLGSKKILRWSVLVRDVRNVECIVELRERHRGFLQRCRDENGTVAGARFQIWKAGAHLNAPVEVTLLSFDQIWARDITRLVATFGHPPLLFGAREEVSKLHSDQLITEDLIASMTMPE